MIYSIFLLIPLYLIPLYLFPFIPYPLIPYTLFPYSLIPYPYSTLYPLPYLPYSLIPLYPLLPLYPYIPISLIPLYLYSPLLNHQKLRRFFVPVYIYFNVIHSLTFNISVYIVGAYIFKYFITDNTSHKVKNS